VPPRLFAAVWPPPAVTDALSRLPRVAQRDTRWTTPDQWHVTLRFFGSSVPAAALDACLAVVRGQPAPATLGPAVRPFGRHLLVVEVAGLDALAAEVMAATRQLVPPEAGRPFGGHLTIARSRGGADLRRWGGQPVAAEWMVDAFALVASELHPHGARYRTVATSPLGKATG
jgi:2'-5' RNA ligase